MSTRFVTIWICGTTQFIAPQTRSKVLLIGGTGLVGGLCLDGLLETEVDQVLVAGRRPCGRNHPKVKDITLDEACKESPDVFISCLGTTIRKAGSREAFRAIDVDLPLRIARAVRERGCQSAALVSAVGANSRVPIGYLQAKGEVEDGFRALGFSSLSILRPCFILGQRPEHRSGEEWALRLLRLLAPLLRGPLSPFRPIEASTIAASLVALCRIPPRGARTYFFEDMATINR